MLCLVKTVLLEYQACMYIQVPGPTPPIHAHGTPLPVWYGGCDGIKVSLLPAVVWVGGKEVNDEVKIITSSTANRKPIGEVCRCESRMAERIH